MKTIQEILSQYFADAKNPTTAEEMTFSSDENENKNEAEVLNFFYSVLPRTNLMRQTKPLFQVLGNAGSGKSAFVDYMLGHEFLLEYGIDLIGVKDSNIPYAPIGLNTALAETKFPEVYEVNDTLLCDGPGLSEYPYLNRMQLFLAELSAKMAAAVIVVVSIGDIQVTSGIYFSQKCVKYGSLLDVEQAQPRILFLLNNKNDSRYTYSSYETRYLCHLRERLNDDLKRINSLIAMLDETRAAEYVRVNLEGFDVELDRNPETAERESRAQHAHNIKTEIENAIKFVALMTAENSLVWSHHEDKKCRAAMQEKMQSLAQSADVRPCFKSHPLGVIAQFKTYQVVPSQSAQFKEQIATWVSHYSAKLSYWLMAGLDGSKANSLANQMELSKPFYADLYEKLTFINTHMGDSEKKVFERFFNLYRDVFDVKNVQGKTRDVAAESATAGRSSTNLFAYNPDSKGAPQKDVRSAFRKV